MYWYSKEASLPLDNYPVNGLFYLDGDTYGALSQQRWTTNRKSPQVLFPSGAAYELWALTPTTIFVNLFGTLDIPFFADRDTVLRQLLLTISSPDFIAYFIYAVATNQISITGKTMDDRVLLTFDNPVQRLVNIERQ